MPGLGTEILKDVTTRKDVGLSMADAQTVQDPGRDRAAITAWIWIVWGLSCCLNRTAGKKERRGEKEREETDQSADMTEVFPHILLLTVFKVLATSSQS